MKIASLLLSVSCCLCFPVSVLAQPKLADISIRGFQIGHATEVTITGQGLTKETRMFLPFPFKQELLSGNGTDELRLKVVLPEDVVPGIFGLRLSNADGISSAVKIGIDRLPHREFQSAKQTLPVALTGTIAGARILKTSFDAQKDELVIVDVEANRLGSKLRPVAHVYDQRGKQVAFAQPSRFLGGDCRCVLKVPKAGEYFVEIHDTLFRGASPGFFRAKIGKFEFADLTLPVAMAAGKKTPVRLIKSDVESEFLEQVESRPSGWWPASPSNPMYSGTRPQLLFSDLAEYQETPGNGETQMAGKVPVGINGRLAKPREKDSYLVEVEPNSKLRFDLLGRRIGSPIDGRIRIKTEEGKQLAENDDRKGEQDSLIDFTVPANVKRLLVEISDVSAKGSKAHVYRLAITPQSRPSVVATIDSDTINLPANGTSLMPVKIQRNQYAGEVELVIKGLNENYEATNLVIAAGSDLGLVTLSQTGKGSPMPTGFTVDAIIDQKGKRRQFEVLDAATATGNRVENFGRIFVVATRIGKQLDLNWTTDAQDWVGNLGGPLRSTVKVKRSPTLKNPIRLRLVTNQKTPKKRVRKNNKDTFVDDVEKTIRMKPVELGADQNEASLEMMIPNDMSEGMWDLVLVAEALSADKKTVLFSAATRPIKLNTQRMGAVKLEKGKLLELPSDGDAVYEVTGSIQRNGHQLPMRVSLSGLPIGVSAAPKIVAASLDQFNLTFELPGNELLRKQKSIYLEFGFFEMAQPERIIGKCKTQKVKLKVLPKKKGETEKAVEPKKAG